MRLELVTQWFLMIFGAFVPYVVIKSSRALRARRVLPRSDELEVTARFPDGTVWISRFGEIGS